VLRLTATELHRSTGHALHAAECGTRVEVVDGRYGDVLAVMQAPEAPEQEARGDRGER
jgi:hypothetical protein